MPDSERIIYYFKKSKPFDELYLNSNVICKWYGNVLKEIDSARMVESINMLVTEICQKLTGDEFDEFQDIYQMFNLIDEYFKRCFKNRSDSFQKVLLDYLMILKNIVQRNDSIQLAKNEVVTIEDVKRIRNHSLLIRFHLDKY